ncbi:DUF739 family protein [Oceanobacillus sojae]|uniref:Repressor n=1 Tax=Oceanobacillus sojae TaxID=582851 RepID=A0A511ZHL8_9BACI|nr:DUF739 family protein [Oceanobacillus sojae]GEN86940.1 repressor [Oceanobacillus sojae]
MKFNYSSLYSKIIEKYGSQYSFAKAIGLSEKLIALKLNGKIGWEQKEIAKAIEILEINSSEIPRYFFNYGVQKN